MHRAPQRRPGGIGHRHTVTHGRAYVALEYVPSDGPDAAHAILLPEWQDCDASAARDLATALVEAADLVGATSSPPDSLAQDIAIALDGALYLADLHPEVVAARTGIPLSDLKAELSGATPLPVGDLLALCDLLNASVSDFVAGVEDGAR